MVLRVSVVLFQKELVCMCAGCLKRAHAFRRPVTSLAGSGRSEGKSDEAPALMKSVRRWAQLVLARPCPPPRWLWVLVLCG